MLKQETCSPRSARGVTLVEALAGTVLLGTILVSILIARGRLRIQASLAEDRIAACAVMDELLNSWWPDGRELQADTTGEVPGKTGWRWKTETMHRPGLEQLAAKVVAVELFSPNKKSPAARVELLLPVQKDSEQEDLRDR